MDHRQILESLPLPLARGYRRFRNAAETREGHDAAYYLFEVYVKYAAGSAIAEYLAGSERDHKVNAVLKGLARPSLGEWLRFLRECVRFLARSGSGAPSPAISAIAELLERRETRWREVVALLNALRAFRGESGEKESVSLGDVLSEVVSYRNRVLGHGAPLAAEHYERFGRLFASAFGELLDHSPFLTARRLVEFDSVQVEDGSRVECRAIEYMGLHPIRRETPLTLAYGAEAPRKQLLHLLGEDGKFLSLDPLLLAHREDIYILNHAEGGAEYLSYATGERHRPSDMEASRGELFERILGYRLDEARLSRMGDDLAGGTPAPGALTPGGTGAATETGGDGKRRLGDYTILREVGRGGMGTVFEAFQESLGRRVALKVLPGSFALDPRRLERFRREARATARIHHPSIVPVYEVGESGGTHYYSMELVDGASLDDLLAEARKNTDSKGARRKISSTSDPASIARVVEEVASLAEGLEEAHRQGLIHRDIKPSNILVDGAGSPDVARSVPLGWRAGRFVLVDFGLVHDVEAQTLTRSGEMVGTLGYMSPEQVSRGEVDARADVYSLGVTLYEILTLRTPFDARSEHEVHRAILFEEPAPPRKLNPRLHRDLETIVLKCLEKHPEKRYRSAGALGKDLRRFLRYEPIEARPQSALSRLGKRAWKHRMPLGVASVLAVLLVAVLFFAGRSREEARLRREAEYGPRVLAAVMKIEQSALSRKSEAGESSINVGALTQVLAEVGIDPLAEAVAALDEAIASVPGRPEAFYYRARALRLQKRVDDVLVDLARVAEIDPGFVPALFLEAEIREKRGEATETAKLRERARAAAKGGWKEAWLRAQDALKNGAWADADRAFGEIIALEAQGGEAYLGASFLTRLGRGRARLEAKEYLPAIDDFAAVEARWPEAREVVLLKGKAYYLLGRKAEAEALFERVHAEAPPDRKDEVTQSVVQVYSGLEPRTALEWCAKLTREFLREQSSVWLLWYLGRPEEAVDAGERAIALNPAFAQAYVDLGFVLTKLGRYSESVRCYRRAVELRSKDPWMWLGLGLPLWNSGRNIEGEAAFEEALKLDATFGVAHTGLACVLENLGDVALAEVHHRKAKVLNPLEPDSLCLRGRFFANQGKMAEALAEFDRSIQMDATIAWPRTLRGWLFQRQGKLEEAMAEFRAATTLFPAGSGHLPLARLLEDQGKLDDALGELAESFKIRTGRLNSESHVAAQGMLKKKDAPLAVAGVERLVSVLEAALPADGDYPELLRTLALARVRLSGVDGAARTLEPIRAALERKGGQDPTLSHVLGEVLLLAGKPTEALAVLEPAARQHHATTGILKTAGECRQALVPRLATPASIEAAVAGRVTEVLIPRDAMWRYFKGTREPPDDWTAGGFDDWQDGKSGFGYGDGDDATVLGDMQGGYTTLYIRRKLMLPDPPRHERFVLSLEVDDGAVVYLNGAEAGRVRAGAAGARLPHDAVATSTAPEPNVANEIPLHLVPGENVLAIQGLNAAKDSSDFSLIPGLLGVLPPDPARKEKLLEAVKAGAEGETGSGLLAFLEGLLLLEEGKRPEAAARLEGAAKAFPRDPLPHLRLAACLRAAGDAKAAEAALRRALEGGLDDREVWGLWAAVSLADLKRAPAEVLAGLPVDPRTPGEVTGPTEKAAGRAADLRWLLEALAKGDGVRINCGGEDYIARDGRTWGRDRFYLSGVLPGEVSGNPWTFTLGIERTEDDPLYQSCRVFLPELIHPPGYRIPLPPGEYRVTLHFAEFFFRMPGWRSFGAILEGKDVLRDHEPLKAGPATAEPLPFRTRVDDGLLDIQLVPGVSTPIVNAIEIERL